MFTSKYGSILLLKPLVSNRPHFAIEIIFANNFPALNEELVFKIHININGHHGYSIQKPNFFDMDHFYIKETNREKMKSKVTGKRGPKPNI